MAQGGGAQGGPRMAPGMGGGMGGGFGQFGGFNQGFGANAPGPEANHPKYRTKPCRYFQTPQARLAYRLTLQTYLIGISAFGSYWITVT